MNTAEKFPSAYFPSTAVEAPHSGGQATRSAWTDLKGVIRGILGIGRGDSKAEIDSSAGNSGALPIVGKVATISAAGVPSITARQPEPSRLRPAFAARTMSPANDRRPGLQNRWKSSDRVAIL